MTLTESDLDTIVDALGVARNTLNELANTLQSRVNHPYSAEALRKLAERYEDIRARIECR